MPAAAADGGKPGRLVDGEDEAFGVGGFGDGEDGRVMGVHRAEGAFLARWDLAKFTAVIDRGYRLSEVPETIRYLEQGKAHGKIIVNLE